MCMFNCNRPMFVYVKTCSRTLIEIRFIYFGKKEIYSIFKTCHIMSV
jgi:hypothetical protein